MDISFDWFRPFNLVDGGDSRLTYVVSSRDDQYLANIPGVYIFGRRHGNKFTPIYIGKALKLRQRIWQQFNNNRLMNALVDAPTGRRQLIVGEFEGKPGQQAGKVIEIVERGLIKLALAQGHDIVNVHGTRLRSHTVEMLGDRSARSWLPRRTIQFE